MAGCWHSAGRQRVVGALAGDAGDPEPVSVFRQFSRSFVSPAEHVNEHPKGIGTRLVRDCGGSAGTRAGSTGGASGSFAQAVSSSASAAQVIFQGRDPGLGIGGLLRDGRGTALFLCALGAISQPLTLGVGSAAVGGRLLKLGHAHGLQSQQRQQHADQHQFPVAEQPG
ncbi:hypothetical protein APR50_10435 [Variovorax paradoxus]|nr:hypothetical protein APR52_20685 [Variovorax paradoxus]KPV08880.1 hypothetical protein APR50_10435 [Variovorax paradoxus]KPV11377.1 hypothetical protein APR49_09310 [Variovorax paradoxus]KPV23269.1 hypothetical protein APR51_07885 [Variovorax paradoxus]KPV31165.1 hypothetical protein APR48_17720 [Variovorax paradoxus]